MFLRVHETPERFVVTREVTPAGATGLDDTIRSGLRNACDQAARVRKRVLIDLRAVLLLDEMMVEVLAKGAPLRDAPGGRCPIRCAGECARSLDHHAAASELPIRQRRPGPARVKPPGHRSLPTGPTLVFLSLPPPINSSVWTHVGFRGTSGAGPPPGGNARVSVVALVQVSPGSAPGCDLPNQGLGWRIEVLCGSPFVVLVDQILNDFADAGSLNAAGIPQSWLSGAMSDKQPAGGQDLGGLVLTLDAERLETLGETGFRQILDLLADQFHEWGAPEELICESCQSQAANSVGLINNISTPLCAECWSEFQSRWPEGRVALSPPPGPVAKHIWWILGGLAVICVLLIFAVQIFLLFI